MPIRHGNTEPVNGTLTYTEWNANHEVTDGSLSLATSDKIWFGTDTNIYRYGANTLTTDDIFYLSIGQLYVGNTGSAITSRVDVLTASAGTTQLGLWEVALDQYGGELLYDGVANSLFLTMYEDSTPHEVFRVSRSGGIMQISQGSLNIGTDVNIYREGSNTLSTDDNFHIGGNLTIDGSYPSVAGGSIITVLSFAVVGTLSTGTDKAPTLLVPCSLTVNKAKIYVKTPPTGDSIVVDINSNGSPIFIGAAKPGITAGAYRDDSGSPTITNLVENDTITVDIDNIGSGTEGEDLTVELLCWQEVV